jgi:small subunit ribosomal protein S1
VLSRRKFLEESQAEQRQDFLQSLDKGEVRTGVVSSIVNFGAFVDLGGVDGLVHVSELSWKHVDHPSEVVEVGQEVNVEVLDVDLDRERVSLSLKATQEDPWRQFARQHEIGDVITGRVTKLVPFGAFVEVDDAIEGLVHISELADHHVERAEDELRVHDPVEVKIIDIDLDRRRISLSRKQALRGAGAEGELPGGATERVRADAAEGEEAPPEAAEMELEGEAAAPEVEAAPEAEAAAEAEAVPEVEEAPEAAVEAPAEEAPQAPEEEAAEVTAEAEEAPSEPEAPAAEETEEAPAAEGGDDSIESIVKDLKRERGQD